MLTELHVSSLAVMEEVRIQLGSGLNVLTGETGAGKSLVVGAIDLVLGPEHRRTWCEGVRRKPRSSPALIFPTGMQGGFGSISGLYGT